MTDVLVQLCHVQQEKLLTKVNANGQQSSFKLANKCDYLPEILIQTTGFNKSKNIANNNYGNIDSTPADITMADVMDPRAVEDQSQAEQENYKVYKRRWLVLFAMFSVTLVVGLHRSLISIENTLRKFMGMSENDYNLMTQVSMFAILASVLAMARALDYFGLRRMVSTLTLNTSFKVIIMNLVTYLPTTIVSNIPSIGIRSMRDDNRSK